MLDLGLRPAKATTSTSYREMIETEFARAEEVKFRWQ
jgi:hypothetical protein